jgi:hypothetical protein
MRLTGSSVGTLAMNVVLYSQTIQFQFLQQVGDSIGNDYGNYRFGIVTNKI